MKIKSLSNEKKPFDIKEWNDEIKAFVKPINGFERLVFNDFFVTFYNAQIDYETRFDAGFRAALLVLVKEDDTPLFEESDRDAVRNGSFLPLFRMFNEVLNAEETLETTKKK